METYGDIQDSDREEVPQIQLQPKATNTKGGTIEHTYAAPDLGGTHMQKDV